MANITLAEKIHDAFLDRDLSPGDINNMIAERLYAMLCVADGLLSATRHGRKVDDKDLEDVYYDIRDFCNELAVPGVEVDRRLGIKKQSEAKCGCCGGTGECERTGYFGTDVEQTVNVKCPEC